VAVVVVVVVVVVDVVSVVEVVESVNVPSGCGPAGTEAARNPARARLAMPTPTAIFRTAAV
jgi:hypothetical protein